MNPAPPTYWSLIRDNGPYRWLWLGQLVSFLGDWFKLVALYTIVQAMTGSAQAIAAVMIAKTLPIFLVMPIAGPVIDRFDRKWILIGSDLARAVLVGGLVIACRMQSLPLLLAVLTVLVGFTGLFLPARTAVIPQLTSDAELPVAMALSAGTWSVMAAVGAALGGLGTQLVGVEGSLVFDGLTYVLSAALLWFLPPLPASDHEGGDTSFTEGLRYLRRHPYLACVISLKSWMALCHGALVMIPIYANGLFDATMGPLYIGLVYAARGVGAVIGTMGLRSIVGDAPRTMQMWILVGFGFIGVAYIAVGFTDNIWTASAGHILAAIGIGIVWVFASTLGQLGSDRNYRGRVFSLEWGVMTLITSLAAWLAGFAFDQGGWQPHQIMWASGALAFVPMVLWGGVILYWLPSDAPRAPVTR